MSSDSSLNTIFYLLNQYHMAEMDEEVVDTDVSLEEVDTEVETEQEYSDISYEQAMEWKKKAESLPKAEKTIVDLKKQLKTAPKIEWEYVSRAEMEIEKFLIKNPDLEEYKSEILEYTNKWLSIKEATILVKGSDKAIENREKANQINITGWDGWSTKTTYSVSELEGMSQSNYNKAMARIDKGEAKLK